MELELPLHNSKDDLTIVVFKSQSTFMTSLVIFNNMIGSTVLILPLVFLKCGILTSFLVFLLIGIVNFMTCKLCLIHLKDNEEDLPEIIERIIGYQWKLFFVVCSVATQSLTGVVFFIIMNNMMYPSIVFILDGYGFTGYATKSEFRFDVYSLQINALILLIPSFASCFLTDLKFITTLSKLGVYVLFAYIIFLFYIFFSNPHLSIESLSEIHYFTTNITEISGAFCMAFIVHLSVCPLVKPMKKITEKTKALGMAYIYSGIFYFLVGIIGSFGVLGRKTKEANPQTIMDFFPIDSVMAFIIEILYFFKLASVFPVLCFISKAQLWTVLEGDNNDGKINKKWWFSIGFNCLYMGFGVFCALFNIDLTFAIGFLGAVLGFFFVYLIPIYFHIKCYGSKFNSKEDCFNNNDKRNCNFHEDKFLYSNILRYTFYLVILVPIGIYLAVIQLKVLFEFKWL